MWRTKLCIVATALFLTACGRNEDPTVGTDPLAAGTPIEAAAEEPELVASDPGGAPTTGRFELGVHYLRNGSSR